MSSTTPMPQPRRRKNRRAAPLGALFLVLAVIGLATVGMLSINLTQQVLDNSKEKAKFERMLLPVLMFDPVPFESPAEADPLAILQYSLWSALYSDKRDSYVYSDNGLLMVPVSDVDVECAKLLGPDIKLEHKSFGDLNITYTLNTESNVYEIPIAAQVGYYTPKVEKISKKGDTYTLTVGYLPPGNAWTSDLSGTKYEPTPDKYMLYVMKKVKGGYNLIAIRDLPTNNASSGMGIPG